MRPLLQKALAVSLAAAAATLLWPADDVTLVPATRRSAAGASAGVPAPATPPVPRGSQAPAGAPPAPASSGLRTRAADWPAPEPAALAAWQGERATSVRQTPTAAAAAASAAPAGTSGTAPAFPYHWIGELDDGAAPQLLLLASPQRSVGVHLGATLDGRWRLQRSADGVLLAADRHTGALQPVRGAPRITEP